MHATAANAMLWLLATLGVAAEMLFQLIPWSLGLVERVDPMLARTLFWFFGHPLVYFWILPAYTIWYTVLPREAGGKLGSKEASASRSRLQGVKTIVVAKAEEPEGKVHDEVRAEGAKEYELTDEGEITDEDKQLEESKGSAASEEVESDVSESPSDAKTM